MTIFHSDRGPARPLIAILAALGLGLPAAAQITVPVAVPSGNAVVLLDVITDIPGPGLTYRFRFVAPHIAGEVGYDAAQADMQHLCDSYVLPRLSAIGPQPSEIVITLASRPVPFGEISPEVVQFFEAYRPDQDGCVWEDY